MLSASVCCSQNDYCSFYDPLTNTELYDKSPNNIRFYQSISQELQDQNLIEYKPDFENYNIIFKCKYNID